MVVIYTRSAMLEDLAQKCMETFSDLAHLDNPDCRIAYQFSNQEKESRNRIVYADVEKVKDKIKAFMRYDFLVTFYEPNCEGLDEEHMLRLMYHELKHIGFEAATDKFWIIPHDVEDFRDVIDRWGLDWIYSKPHELTDAVQSS